MTLTIRGSHLAPVEGAGYLYALNFTNGMVKVGKSINPLQRVDDHLRFLRRAGARLCDFWFSHAHPHFDTTELLVIEAAEALMTPESHKSGREWFYNIDYNALVMQCATLAPCSDVRDANGDCI